MPEPTPWVWQEGDYACKPPPWTREGLWEPEVATASIPQCHTLKSVQLQNSCAGQFVVVKGLARAGQLGGH